MGHYEFTFQSETLHALPSGTLFWPAQNLLCVSDLHLGKAQRYAAQGSSLLPPYEAQDTLMRLDQDLEATGADTIVCLGDSFDSLRAGADLDSGARDWIIRMQAGRRWIWIEGNHDPGPIDIGGTHLDQLKVGTIIFRHIAEHSASGEISGHYHPKLSLKARGHRISRRCFAMDRHRIIMPAFGTYTGGLSVQSEPLQSLLKAPVLCVLSGGETAQPVPRPAAP
ncbi:MAG: ligase-associated DNA damage response endonuclease PdeM [Planktotalea sp.]|uniref:ligase-associated DNA damage response endonuclease PdeM n=1 Tax=Planktotalea sp. TaxID=2029877 RepID=UPI003C716797